MISTIKIAIALTFFSLHTLLAQDSLFNGNGIRWTYTQLKLDDNSWEKKSGYLETYSDYVIWEQESGVKYQINTISNESTWVSGNVDQSIEYVIIDGGGSWLFERTDDMIISRLQLNYEDGNSETYQFKIKKEPEPTD